MARQKIWFKGLSSAATALILLIQSSYGLAAPMDLSLEDGIAVVLKKNSVIKLVQAEKTISALELVEAKARFGPTLTFTHTDKVTNQNSLNVSASSWRDINNKFNIGLPSNPISLAIDNEFTVSLPVYTSGKMESQVKQAKINYQVADLNVSKTVQELKLNTTIAYFDVLQYQNLLQVRQNSTDNIMAHIKSVQIQYDSGAVDKSHVLRSEVELGNSQQDLIKAQNRYEVAIVKFKKLLGLPHTSQVRLTDTLKYEDLSLSLDDCLRCAIEYRPDLGQAQAVVQSAEEGIKLAKTENLPQVSLRGDINLNDNRFPGLKNGNWAVGLVVSINVFDSGLANNKVKISEIGLAEAKEKVTQAEDVMVEEISEAYLNLKETEKRIEISRTLVDKAEECYKIASIRYEEGAGTNLEVIDAQLALTQAKANHVQTLYDYNSNKAILRKEMGVL